MRALAVAVLAGCASAQTPAPRGVILVSMDTLRADYTTPYGAAPDATPTLAALASEGVVFERAYAQSNETLFSHGSMFTSRIPSDVAPVDYDFTIPNGTPTIASQMKAAGFQTGAVVASGHLARVFGLDDGFDQYAEGQWWGSFQETVPMALRWLDGTRDASEPFFLFLHGYDAHNPYVKPGVFARLATPGRPNPVGPLLFDPLFYERVWKGTYYPDFPIREVPNERGTPVVPAGLYGELEQYAQRTDVHAVPLRPQQREFLLGTYASAALYADMWLGVFLAELKSRGLLETTTVVVVSDHGEALLDYGLFNHRHTLRDASTHVPFIVRPAGGTKAARVSTPVALLDVAPTLLELAGASPAPGMEGRSLVSCFSGNCPEGSLTYGEGVAGQVGVTDGTWRLVVTGKDATDPAFEAAVRAGEGVRFALYTTADGETIDHAGEPDKAPIVARLVERMVQARGGAS